MKRPSASNLGIVVSIVFHLLIASVPLTMAIGQRTQSDEKKVDLIFEKPKPQTKPKPEPPRPKPTTKEPTKTEQPRLLTNPEPIQEPTLSPIEAQTAQGGGIDIPTGRAYEEPYVPPRPKPKPVYVPYCGNGIKDAGEECDGGRGCNPDCTLINRDAIMKEYASKVSAIVARNKRYPRWAREEGFEGAALLTFSIISNGSASEARVTRSSGFKVLDDAAVETVRGCGAFPPLPPELEMNTVSISVSIVYELD